MRAMTSDDIPRAQLDQLRERVRRPLQFLNRLTQRMNRKFPPGDRLFVAARQARNSMQDLFVAIHYASMESGVGKPEKLKPAAPELPQWRKAMGSGDSQKGTGGG